MSKSTGMVVASRVVWASAVGVLVGSVGRHAFGMQFLPMFFGGVTGSLLADFIHYAVEDIRAFRARRKDRTGA